MKRILPMILVLCMLLCACSFQGEQTEPTANSTTPSTQPEESTEQTQATEQTNATEQTSPTEETKPVETTQPTESTEPVAQYVNPFTGETLSEPFTARPFFISIGNTKSALPHMGANDADIIFEMLANSGITRCVALVTDVNAVEVIGSIRSLRYNFTDVAKAYDGIVVYASASSVVLQDLANSAVDHLNALGGNNGGAFYRDQDRLNNGYPREHTLFANPALMQQLAQKKGYSVTTEANKDYGLSFAEDGTPAGGEKADTISLKFSIGNKVTTMQYDSATQRYHFRQYSMDLVDGNTNQPESFKNVFTLFAKNTNQGVYHVLDLLGEGDGYYACGGKIIPIRWHRETENSPFTYTHLDGTPLQQGVGNSYVGLAPIGSTVSYS